MRKHFQAVRVVNGIFPTLTGLFTFFHFIVLDMSIYCASDRVAVQMGARNPFKPKKPIEPIYNLQRNLDIK
jgi:hypothetical protein